jgi:predicted acylesterase/phospholipase RssA
MSIEEKLTRKGPRRLLALDGGGIRGVIAIEILARIEKLLREREQNSSLVLADYFDYMAGTSTGAIIAAALSLGKPMDEIRAFYHEDGPQMFSQLQWFNPKRWFQAKFTPKYLTQRLKAVFGEQVTLGSPQLKTLLLVILRNETTDSPWPLSNNPQAKYNDPNHPGCNLKLPLWQVVRASTAAPTFFPPETVAIGPERFIFVDGGVTPFNNPALQLLTMATAEPYRLNWPTGAEQLLLVSVGTGSALRERAELRPQHMNLLYTATTIPGSLMGAISVQQDLMCRVLGQCRFGSKLDAELDTMIDPGWPYPGKSGASGPADPKLFSYIRYEPDLTRQGLDLLGLKSIPVEHVLKMDAVQHLKKMASVGMQAAEQFVQISHFDGF